MSSFVECFFYYMLICATLIDCRNIFRIYRGKSDTNDRILLYIRAGYWHADKWYDLSWTKPSSPQYFLHRRRNNYLPTTTLDTETRRRYSTDFHSTTAPATANRPTTAHGTVLLCPTAGSIVGKSVDCIE